MPRSRVSFKTLGMLLTILFAASAPPGRAERLDDWAAVIRATPYWVSQGVYDNLTTIRRWVLTGESYCAVRDRHLLFDLRATFLGYMDDAETPVATQERLNALRHQLETDGATRYWVPATLETVGYPFALSCNQPDAELELALARYLGDVNSARLWGTWDGMQIGTPDHLVSLHRAIRLVYEDRRERGRISLPPEVLRTLAGKVLIESGGRARAHSAADARGVMQLSPGALKDCELDAEFHFHRLAQVNCALRLLEQNHRNLRPVYDQAFGHLPNEKADELYSLLIIQAYHGGIGRVGDLLASDAAEYFAANHEQFSAGDIAVGLVFHNLGRHQLGFASLYYVTDVAIAMEVACSALDDLPGC